VGTPVDFASEAFTEANVGILVGTGTNLEGTDLAGVVVLGKKLVKIPHILRYCRRISFTIDLGLFMGLLYSVAIGVLAFTGWFSPLMMALLMTFITIPFVLLPLRLKRVRFGAESQSQLAPLAVASLSPS
jgi:cation transport ATPase